MWHGTVEICHLLCGRFLSYRPLYRDDFDFRDHHDYDYLMHVYCLLLPSSYQLFLSAAFVLRKPYNSCVVKYAILVSQL